MKKTLIISFLMLNIIVSFSQSIVTSNKLWYNIIFYYSPNSLIGMEVIKFTNDTVINSITYKKVERSLDDAHINWSPYGYIRENSSKEIFFKINPLDPERLLYDLNVQLYDTILVYGLVTYYLTEYKILKPMTLYVNMIDSVLIGQIYQKRINLGSYPTDSLTIWDRWIDSTGSMTGMLHNGGELVNIDDYSLVCYFEDEILKYHNQFFDCSLPTPIPEKNDLIPIVTISPNPITDVSTLTVNCVEDANLISIRFFNLFGKEVLCKNGEKRIEINNRDISPGIYFYCLTINHTNSKIGKIIIN